MAYFALEICYLESHRVQIYFNIDFIPRARSSISRKLKLSNYFTTNPIFTFAKNAVIFVKFLRYT